MSISRPVLARITLICSPIARAAGSMSLNVVSKVLGLAGLTKTATAAACGTSSRNSSSCLATRPRETLDETEPHRVFGDDEKNGNRRGRRLRSHDCGDASTPNDDRHAPANQLGRQFGQSIDLILSPAVEDRYIVAFHIAGLAKTL